jgi:ribosomal protein L21E
MVDRMGGMRRKSRHKMLKDSARKGKISLQSYFQKFAPGDKVHLIAESAVQQGHYFTRYHNRNGTIKGMQGKCYFVKIKDLNAEKTLLVHPIHLRKA